MNKVLETILLNRVNLAGVLLSVVTVAGYGRGYYVIHYLLPLYIYDDMVVDASWAYIAVQEYAAVIVLVPIIYVAMFVISMTNKVVRIIPLISYGCIVYCIISLTVLFMCLFSDLIVHDIII